MHKTMWAPTIKLWLFGLVKIPMVWWLKPRVVTVNNEEAKLLMKFRHRAKNHLNSMYFGVLCSCADIVGGLHVMHFFNNKLNQYSFVFKDVHASFLKRAEKDVIFISKNGDLIEKTMQKAKEMHERQNQLITVNAYTVPDHELVAEFKMTLSIKAR